MFFLFICAYVCSVYFLLHMILCCQAMDFMDDDETDDELTAPQHRRPATAVSISGFI